MQSAILKMNSTWLRSTSSYLPLNFTLQHAIYIFYLYNKNIFPMLHTSMLADIHVNPSQKHFSHQQETFGHFWSSSKSQRTIPFFYTQKFQQPLRQVHWQGRREREEALYLPKNRKFSVSIMDTTEIKKILK